MDEGVRRRYLKAMGVELWERRPPPGMAAQRPPDPPAALDEGVPPLPATTDLAPAADSPSPLDGPGPAGPDAALDWEGLRRAVRECRACGLRAGCRQTVFGVGDPQADLLVIGEAPGADEDRQGEPFVGRAGQLLNAMLLAMGLRREQVFIANVVKCRPPNNRDPQAGETTQCEPFLRRQIELIEPRVILSVGRVSAHSLLKTEVALGRLRGQVHRLGEPGIPLVVTYHPAYLLRSPEQKGRAWDDLQLALSLLQNPA